MLDTVYQMIDEHYDEMVEIRRYLHQHPELSFQEFKTAEYIANYYKKLQIPYETNVGGNGVIAKLIGGKPGKTIALRADFDALPINDEKSVAYRSKVPGVMHACGHDAHTATLLVLAKILQQFQADLEGTIIFLHQHAEEQTPGGAVSIVASGALDDVDVYFGNHFWSTLPLGQLSSRPGDFMAGTDSFELTILGKGGHGAYPHETKDAIVVGAEVVSTLQTIVSRKVSPIDTAVITIGQFIAGHAFNVIADKASIKGTVRYFEKHVQENIKAELQRIIKGICLANDVDYELNYQVGYPPVKNHHDEVALVYEVANTIDGINKVTDIEAQMGGEDFAYYLQEKPGAFFFTGANKVGNDSPHHHPLFDIAEEAMPIAAKMFVGLCINYQAIHK